MEQKDKLREQIAKLVLDNRFRRITAKEAGSQTKALIEDAKKQERERILTDDLSLDVFHRMEMWWYEPENTVIIEGLCPGEFDEVSKLLRSFITTLRQALSKEE